VLLLADSQLLFRRDADGRPALAELRRRLPGAAPPAVYLGASNGELPEFYELFSAGMQALGLTNCRHVRVPADADARQALAQAELVFLAGGDVVQGWLAWQRDALVELLAQRLEDGAQFVGLSAGAIQLGRPSTAWRAPDGAPLAMLSAVPYAVDAHDEPAWARLHAALLAGPADLVGLGVPTAGAAWVGPAGQVVSLNKPAERLACRGAQVESLALPVAEAWL
jgi:hypothetical protein